MISLCKVIIAHLDEFVFHFFKKKAKCEITNFHFCDDVIMNHMYPKVPPIFDDIIYYCRYNNRILHAEAAIRICFVEYSS